MEKSPDSPVPSQIHQNGKPFLRSENLSSVFLHGTFKGEPAITIPQDVEASLAARFENTLIGKFSQGRPSMDIIRKFVAVQNFKGKTLIGLIDKKHILIRFDNSEDYVRLFSRLIWNVNGKPMRILKWTSDFSIDRESSIVPIWISLPMLPIHLANQDFIFSLVSSFSKPLRIDNATQHLKRPSVARVQVEFNLLDLMPPRVWVQSEKGTSFWQNIEIEEVLPLYCKYCLHLGHHEHFCTVKHPELHRTYTTQQSLNTHKEYRPKQTSEGIRIEDNRIASSLNTKSIERAVETLGNARDESQIFKMQGMINGQNSEVKKVESNQGKDVNGEKKQQTNEADTQVIQMLEIEGPAKSVVNVSSSLGGDFLAVQQPIIQKQETCLQKEFREHAEIGQKLNKGLNSAADDTIKFDVVAEQAMPNASNSQQSNAATVKLLEGTLVQMKDQNHQNTLQSASLSSSADPISMGTKNDNVAAPMGIKGPTEVVINDSGEFLARGNMDEMIAYSESCPISNPFEVLSMPSTKGKSTGIDKLSIQAELRYMSLDPKTQLGEYITDKKFEEKFTPAKKPTRTRKPKQIFDI